MNTHTLPGAAARPVGVTHPPLQGLHASHTGAMTLAMSPELCAAKADAEGRTVEGIVVPYGPIGYTNIGPVRIRAGALRLPAELSAIKLVDEHQSPPKPIGHAIAAEDRPEGMWMRFRIGTTVLAANALTEALDKLRDAFSVELSNITHTDTTIPEVTAAYLPAVAFVTVPAFDTARVSSVAASLAAAPSTTTPEGTTQMTDEQRARLAELRAKDTITAEEATELAMLAVAEHTADQTPAEAPAADASQAAALAASHVTPSPARLPGGLQAPAAQVQAGRHSINELFAAQARVFGGTSRPELEAALSNITSTANIWTQPDSYAGELWSGVAYSRRYVGLMNHARLTARKMQGWRWVVRPQVDDYAGDKTAVPSNQPTTEAVEVTAARLAGAHDIDRAEVDFGNTEFIASYYRAMTESYAVKSDRKARAALVAAGNANVSATAATGLWDALLVARMDLTEYEDDDFMAGEPDFYMVNPADLRAVLGTTAQNAPAYLGDLGISVDKLMPTAAVPAKSVIAGVKNAQTFYELGTDSVDNPTPIRVEAINIANGGVDGGVFGYWANLRHHDKGTVRVNWA